MGDLRPVAGDYRLLMLIGKGSFSETMISMAKHLPTCRILAIRVVNLDTTQLSFNLIHHEIQMHRILRHRNILPAFDCFIHHNEVWTVLPYASYGSCRDVIHAHFKSGLPEPAIAYIVKDVLDALDYLHSRAIIHRCLKASHILIHADGTACLTGLRHCYSMLSNGRRMKAVHDFPDQYSLCLNWASRELLEQSLSGYDTKSDIYSLGITVCELANGVVPFQDMPLTQMLLSKIEGTTPRLLDLSTVPELQNQGADNNEAGAQKTMELSELYARVFSPSFHAFIENCLQYDPESRDSAAVLASHQFLKQIKRKSNPRPLTELLRPLNPVTENSVPQGVMTTIESLTSAMEDTTIDANWTFD